MRKVGQRIEVTTYLLVEEDSELIAYLKSQTNRSAAARRLLKLGFGGEQNDRTGASITDGSLKQAIAEGLSMYLDPALFRQIVEAGVSNALAGLDLATLGEESSFTEATEAEEDDGLDVFVM
jgi:hypothetical protein